MKTKLTKRFLESLHPQAKDVLVWDEELGGFYAKMTPAGRVGFHLVYRIGGVQRKVKIGDWPALSPDTARKLANDMLYEVARGNDPGADRRTAKRGSTLGEFYDNDFLGAIGARVKASTVQWYKKTFKAYLRPVLGAKKITAISHTDIVRLHAGLVKTPYAANRSLAVVRSILSYAVELGLIENNPARQVRKNREHSRERVLTPEEISRLMTALDDAEKNGASPHVVNALRFLFWSGGRKSEVTNLEWGWIDGERKTIRYPDIASKGGAKTVPISATAWGIIEKQKAFQESGPFVFIGRGGGPVYVDWTWRVIRKAAGLPDLRLHDLRHNALTYGALLGLSGPMLKGLAGHKDLATTARYLHVAGDSTPLRAAADLLGVALQKALEVGNGKTLELAVETKNEEGVTK